MTLSSVSFPWCVRARDRPSIIVTSTGPKANKFQIISNTENGLLSAGLIVLRMVIIYAIMAAHF